MGTDKFGGAKIVIPKRNYLFFLLIVLILRN